MSEIIKHSSEYFDPETTLSCGQTFRFSRHNDGFLTVAKSRAFYIYKSGGYTVIESDDSRFAEYYFDLATDYACIVSKAKSYGIPALTVSAEAGKGIRILRQDSVEMLFTFLISQNNNIPRIRKSVMNLSEAAGEHFTFRGEEYSSFPETDVIAGMTTEKLRSFGVGYRDKYLSETAKRLRGIKISSADTMSTEELREFLLSFPGIGEKIADCVLLFGFHRTDTFPVDTWIERLYRENFGGKLTDRKKISAWFTDLFGNESGYFQQYLFHAKRMKRI